ncbi:MAG: hypothetical protein IJ444_03205 [Kiritimatiellae bacterium]|nr:hypothetical protein [Kiritimatiellia bacterium]
MKKITLTILATILLFSFGCSKKPQTIEEKAKAEVQSFFDAIDEGVVLTYLYNSDYVEDREFLNQVVNTAAKNLDEDIYNQAMHTVGSFAEVIDIQSDNISLVIIDSLKEINELEEFTTEETIDAHTQSINSGVDSISEALKTTSQIKFEDLHKHNAFEKLITKFDKSASAILSMYIFSLGGPKSADDLTFIKVDEATVSITYKDYYDSPLFLRLNNEKWELYEFLDEEKICFKPSNEDKVEILNEIAAGLRSDENDEDGIYEKAKAIQELKLIEESFAPLKEKMEYESFETTVNMFIFMLMMML